MKIGISSALFALFAVTTSSCGAKESPVATATVPAHAAAAPSSAWIDMRLRDGRPEPASRPQQAPAEAPAQAMPLPNEDTARLLARLPALPPAPAPTPALPGASTRAPAPPPAGAVVQSRFPLPGAQTPPPAAANASPALEPLTVVRRAPEGEVQMAPHLRVTFSHPMVAVTSQSQQDDARVPVRITPAPPGTWRWLGTQTLQFEPETRFAQATAYRVEIPAGTRAATGQTLDSPVSWTFATPPPRVVSRWPNEWIAGKPQPRQPLLIAVFDQRVDPAAVLPAIRVRTGKTVHLVRLVAKAEIASLARMSRDPDFQDSIDEALQSVLDEALPGRVVAFTVAAPLPADTEVTVTIGPGAPSAEGARTQQKAHGFSFRTIGPLRVRAGNCQPDRPCKPGEDWVVTFSDYLDPGSLKASTGASTGAEQIRIEPALSYRHIEISRNQLRIDNLAKARTRYTVTLPAHLADVNGQVLGTREPITFTVGPALPNLHGPRTMMVLDPAADRPTVEVDTTNIPALSVRLYRVTPRDWPAYQAYRDALNSDTPLPPPGKLVARSRVTVDSEPDQEQETRIELGPALGNGPGHVLAIVEPASWPVAGEGEKPRTKPVVRVWAQKTDIGLAAFTDEDELAGWATSLDTGAALPGVALRILPDRGPRAQTDAQGTARLPLPHRERQELRLLVAQRGRDTALLPSSRFGSVAYSTSQDGRRLLWYVFDDRQTYRPGERVHVKGWLRIEDQDGAPARPEPGATRVSYVLEDAKDVELARGEVPVNDAGGFHMALSLPRDVNLGQATLALQAQGPGGALGSEQHHFDIEEFRRPELEVHVRASQEPHIVGEPIDITMKARYYTGERVTRAPVRWRITAEPRRFTPPGWNRYDFGVRFPWWAPTHDPKPVQQAHAARSDADGAHVLRLDVLRVNPLWAMSIEAEAEAEDVNRQTWADKDYLLVHPSALYVGLAMGAAGTPPYDIRAGEPLHIRAVAVDHDGNTVAGRDVRVRAERMRRKYSNQFEVVDTQACTQTSARTPVTCTFDTGEGDWYRISARVTDEQGRPSESQLLAKIVLPPDPDDDPDDDIDEETDDGYTAPTYLSLSADQDTYGPGDTARIRVKAPFYPAEGILVLDHAGIGQTRRFHVSGPATTLEIPITDLHVPQVHVHVTLVGAVPAFDVDHLPAEMQPEQLPREPVHDDAGLTLQVSPEHRRLTVDIAPARPEVAPGERTELAIHVRDAGGKPVAGAEVAVVVVDAAILALSGYYLHDPIHAFHPRRRAVVDTHHLRRYVELAPLEIRLPDGTILHRGGSGSGYGYGSGSGGMRGRRSSPPALDLRTNLDPLALFAPEVRTDARGRARVPFTLPDSLTRYRIMAVAVHGDRRFGKGESQIIARKPLMVRPSPPRFARLGDTFELPVVVHNHTGEDWTVDLAARARGLRLLAGAGRRITVAAGARAELRLPAVAETLGEAQVQVAAVAGTHADAAEIVIPVHAPLTTEVSATYGDIGDAGGAIRQPVAVPAGAHPTRGGLEITTASTQLQPLTDALLYLVEYPYGCSEQISSRVLAVTSLGHVLETFDAAGLPPPADIRAAVARDLETLAARQNPDGGFGLWRGGTPSSLFASIHAAYALHQAHARGLLQSAGRAAVPARVLHAAHAYLRDIEKHIPADYPAAARHAALAYALMVRARMGDAAPARARALIREVGTGALSLETAGWLLGALDRVPGAQAERAELLRHLYNRVSETAAGAHFVDTYSEGAHLILHGDRRADAVILDALLATRPGSDLIPKLARGLLAGRARGRWRSTQVNAFALVALARYLDTHEQTTPAFVARTWLGDRFAGEHRFQGRTTERHRIDIPMAHLAGQATSPGDATNDVTEDVLIHKDGPGRLYYRIAMRHTPAEPMVPADDRGFAVTRTYEAASDPTDVRRDADGTWHIRAGARVRVRVHMRAPARRHHVALVVPLPAGLEPVNPALAGTAGTPSPSGESPMGPSTGWRHRFWYEHQNLRDDRAEAFASTLRAGPHEYTFMARATTPGNFVTPPARAEEMYTPETYGRSAADRVRID